MPSKANNIFIGAIIIFAVLLVTFIGLVIGGVFDTSNTDSVGSVGPVDPDGPRN